MRNQENNHNFVRESDVDFNIEEVEQVVAPSVSSLSEDGYTASTGTSIAGVCRCS
jgi:hypothetical protein